MFHSLVRQWITARAIGAIQDAVHSAIVRESAPDGSAEDPSKIDSKIDSKADLSCADNRDGDGRNTDRIEPVDIGMVFAMPMEAAGVVDRLTRSRTVAGERVRYHTGLFAGHRVAVVESGMGQEKALDATRRLLHVFRPQRLLSAGYAGGLRTEMKRDRLVIPSRLVRASDGETIDLTTALTAALTTERMGRGSDAAPSALPGSPPITLLTADRVVRTPKEKTGLAERFGADLVDMETWAVADLCRRYGIPFLALRIVLDTASEELAEEVQRIVDSSGSGSTARMFGSVVGALWKRPSSLVDLYQLKERALVATDKLASGIEALLDSTTDAARQPSGNPIPGSYY